MTRAPAGAVLLAAGRGSRLSALTERTHKSLLPVAGRPALGYAIDEVLASGVADIVVVTGDKREAVEQFVRDNYGAGPTLTYNDRFAVDTNILSTEKGVSALRCPENGYLILETDLVVEPDGWSSILDVGDGAESFWVTRGTYHQALTGGALQADAEGRVTGLVYAPEYAPAYDGWLKLVGALYVGRDQVSKDRELRQRAIEATISQYYMTPWVENLAALPCRARVLGDLYAASYNDIQSYHDADRDLAAVLASRRAV